MNNAAYSLVFALIAMFFWGIAPLFAKFGLGNVEPVTAMSFRSAIITVVLSLYLIFSGKMIGFESFTVKDLMFIFLDGIFGALLAQLAFYYALKFGEVNKVTAIAASFPLVTVLFSAILLHEKLKLLNVVGAIFIVAGVIMIKMQ